MDKSENSLAVQRRYAATVVDNKTRVEASKTQGLTIYRFYTGTHTVRSTNKQAAVKETTKTNIKVLLDLTSDITAD